MLRMAKQDGPTCLAFALYNAGVIDEIARDEYVQKAYRGWEILRTDPAYMLFGAGFISPEMKKYSAGSEEFARPWLMKYAPQMYDAIKAAIWSKTDHQLASEHTEKTIPKTGKGTVLIMYSKVSPGAHIVAYENGMIVDSDAPIPSPETWEQHVARIEARGQHAAIIDIIPLED